MVISWANIELLFEKTRENTMPMKLHGEVSEAKVTLLDTDLWGAILPESREDQRPDTLEDCHATQAPCVNFLGKYDTLVCIYMGRYSP